jgi:Trk K+ transport system NAD-binding subunit
MIMGDSNNEETLRSAGVQRCESVLAITNGDTTNLESAMLVRDLNPNARTTMRMFAAGRAGKWKQRGGSSVRVGVVGGVTSPAPACIT